MQFEWDAAKNQANIHKHGFDFNDAWQIFGGPMAVALDDRHDYGEARWIGIGFLQDRIVVVVFSDRDEDTIRIVSLRKALTHECDHYEQFLKDRLDQG